MPQHRPAALSTVQRLLVGCYNAQHSPDIVREIPEMENNIFKIERADTKPLAKLVQTIWTDLFQPYAIRREAKAKSDARLIEIKGEIEAQALLATLEDRKATRESLTELRRQRNLESIVQGSIQYLPESVSDEQVDPDWTAQFFNSCQDVSNEEMQSLWSKILAGEVSKPRSFSRHTIDRVRVLDQRDADLFSRFCAFVCGSDDAGEVYYRPDDHNQFLKAKGIKYADLIHLQSLGLVTVNDTIAISLSHGFCLGFHYHGREHSLSLPGTHAGPVSVPLYPLSRVGRELFSISGAIADPDYISALAQLWKEGGLLFA